MPQPEAPVGAYVGEELNLDHDAFNLDQLATPGNDTFIGMEELMSLDLDNQLEQVVGGTGAVELGSR